MSDLLVAVTTPLGQQTNVSAGVLSGKVNIFPEEGMRMSDEVAVVMTAAHHAQVGRALSLMYDLSIGTGQEVFQQMELSLAASNYEYLRRRLDASDEVVKNAVDMNPRVLHGNPAFRGTRIPVYQIIEELADGTPLNELPEGYPSLSLEQIQRGLDFVSSVMRIYDEQISDR